MMLIPARLFIRVEEFVMMLRTSNSGDNMPAKTKSSNGVQRAIPSSCPLTLYIQDLHKKGQSIRLRLNGQRDLEIRDEGSYQKLLELVERVETINGLNEALADVEIGHTLSLDELKERVRKKHGISH
jgi:hypothetical protein